MAHLINLRIYILLETISRFTNNVLYQSKTKYHEKFETHFDDCSIRLGCDQLHEGSQGFCSFR